MLTFSNNHHCLTTRLSTQNVAKCLHFHWQCKASSVSPPDCDQACQDPVVTNAASATVSVVANLSRIQYCIKYLLAGYSTLPLQPVKVRSPMSSAPPVKTGILPLPTCIEPGPYELSTGVDNVTFDIEKMTRPGAVNAKLICMDPCRQCRTK